MKVDYDEEVDAAHIALSDGLGIVSKTIPVTEGINLDFGREGHLIGIEVLAASKVLPRTFFDGFVKPA